VGHRQLIHLISNSDYHNPVIPIIGKIDRPSEWVHIVKDSDVLIDCVGGTADVKSLSETVLQAVSKAARELRLQGAPKLTYIYTSGTWVHGDNRNDVVCDTTPITSPPSLVSWRPGREQQVINDQSLNGIVIRPALLYGRSGSLLAPFFKDASEGKVWYPGTPGGRFSVIHTDDLADLYVRASEKAAICGGRIFDAANDTTESVDDVLATLVRVSGARGPYEYREPTNGMFFPLSFDSQLLTCTLLLAYEVALGTTSLLRPYLARALLGWQPMKPGFVDGLPIYYAAWKASQ
jgi:nucleoside-diphosphate-sugar epimerase